MKQVLPKLRRPFSPEFSSAWPRVATAADEEDDDDGPLLEDALVEPTLVAEGLATAEEEEETAAAASTTRSLEEARPRLRWGLERVDDEVTVVAAVGRLIVAPSV